MRGFDDIPEAAYFCPQLTTLRQDLYELGGLAVQALANRLPPDQDNAAPITHSQVLSPVLVVRQSSRANR